VGNVVGQVGNVGSALSNVITEPLGSVLGQVAEPIASAASNGINALGLEAPLEAIGSGLQSGTEFLSGNTGAGLENIFGEYVPTVTGDSFSTQMANLPSTFGQTLQQNIQQAVNPFGQAGQQLGSQAGRQSLIQNQLATAAGDQILEAPQNAMQQNAVQNSALQSRMEEMRAQQEAERQRVILQQQMANRSRGLL